MIDHTNCNFQYWEEGTLIVERIYIYIYYIKVYIQVENKYYIVAKCTKSILLDRKRNKVWVCWNPEIHCFLIHSRMPPNIRIQSLIISTCIQKYSFNMYHFKVYREIKLVVILYFQKKSYITHNSKTKQLILL